MNKYKNYAMSAVSHILQNLPEVWSNKIKNVILFGSAARNTANQESDIDIFIDMELNKSQLKTFKKNLNKTIEEFYISNIGLRYKMEGIDNKINVITGQLDEWTDLKRSIMSTGIVLFGQYKSGLGKNQLKQHFIISWDPPKKNRGAFLNALYGYSVKKKRYLGMVKKYDCIRMGKSAIIVPSEHKNKFIEHMKKYEINYKILEAFL